MDQPVPSVTEGCDQPDDAAVTTQCDLGPWECVRVKDKREVTVLVGTPWRGV